MGAIPVPIGGECGKQYFSKLHFIKLRFPYTIVQSQIEVTIKILSTCGFCWLWSPETLYCLNTRPYYLLVDNKVLNIKVVFFSAQSWITFFSRIVIRDAPPKSKHTNKPFSVRRLALSYPQKRIGTYFTIEEMLFSSAKLSADLVRRFQQKSFKL